MRWIWMLLLLTVPRLAAADPCGMVPPIDTGGAAPPIVRVGLQRTYVCFARGIQSIAIRPAFRGRSDGFGMLIPFPSPPAIRKVGDDVFEHLARAVDPPEVQMFAGGPGVGIGGGDEGAPLQPLRVLREEAIGMYQVAVLEAGSPAALARWMTDNGYRYPTGMDAACADYIGARWCFVAVKIRVVRKKDVDPRPGQQDAGPASAPGFTGAVQALGFRFRVRAPVVPMRLSAFNAGRLRNVMFVLAPGPVRVAELPLTMVVRQLPGATLRRHLVDPLPIALHRGSLGRITRWDRRRLATDRDPTPVNGLARDLIAGDLAAARRGRLSSDVEATETALLEIGERLRLRDPALDPLHRAVLAAAREREASAALGALDAMTLTVVDGDFPREVIAARNLTFAPYRMPTARNSPVHYDARWLGPGVVRPGIVGPSGGGLGPLALGLAGLVVLLAAWRVRR